MHDLLIVCPVPCLAEAPSSRGSRRASREDFTRRHFAVCAGDPKRLAALAVETGFYSPRQSRRQIAWRFERTLRALSLIQIS